MFTPDSLWEKIQDLEIGQQLSYEWQLVENMRWLCPDDLQQYELSGRVLLVKWSQSKDWVVVDPSNAIKKHIPWPDEVQLV